MRLAFFLSLFICLKDTARCGDTSSPHDVIDVMIVGEKQKAPEVLKPPGLIAGVGVRHALFPIGTRLGALAFAGGVLPDATLRGMRMFRSHGGTVPTVAGRNLRVRPLRPVRILPAGRFAPDVVLTRLQRCFASAP